MLTAHVGERCPGLTGLAISLTVAAFVAAPLGAPQALPHLTVLGVLTCAGLAVLGPALPYAAEMTALRVLAPAVFGVWMSLEPAIGTAVGLLVLHQVPDVVQLVGVLLVVAASVGAERTAASSRAGNHSRQGPDVDPPRRAAEPRTRTEVRS
jgi:inner membrane transporter RhtA